MGLNSDMSRSTCHQSEFTNIVKKKLPSEFLRELDFLEKKTSLLSIFSKDGKFPGLLQLFYGITRKKY